MIDKWGVVKPLLPVHMVRVDFQEVENCPWWSFWSHWWATENLNGGPEFDFWMRKGVIHVHDAIKMSCSTPLEVVPVLWELLRGETSRSEDGGPKRVYLWWSKCKHPREEKRGYTSIATTPIIIRLFTYSLFLYCYQAIFTVRVLSRTCRRCQWTCCILHEFLDSWNLGLHLLYYQGEVEEIYSGFAFCFAHLFQEKNSQESLPGHWWALWCDSHTSVSVPLLAGTFELPCAPVPSPQTFADLEILIILWRARPARPLPQSVWANFGSGKLEHYRAAAQ